MKKLTTGAQELKEYILGAFDYGPIVQIHLSEYALETGITVRSAQRRIKELENQGDLRFGPRGRGVVTIIKSQTRPYAEFEKADHAFWTPAEFKQNKPAVSFASFASLLSISYIKIYGYRSSNNNSNKILISDDANDTENDTGDTTPTALWLADTDGDYQDLALAVCHVTKLSALLLDDDSEKKIMQMFQSAPETGITADRVLARYGPEKRPNFWWNGYWKGRDRHARPTIKDIMETWMLSGEWEPHAFDGWPPFKEIVAAIEDIIREYKRARPESAMDALAEFGYDEIVNRIPGGYVQLVSGSEKAGRIAIAQALKEIREEAHAVVA